MAIHHAWKVAEVTGEGVVSFGSTSYRGMREADNFRYSVMSEESQGTGCPVRTACSAAKAM